VKDKASIALVMYNPRVCVQVRWLPPERAGFALTPMVLHTYGAGLLVEEVG